MLRCVAYERASILTLIVEISESGNSSIIKRKDIIINTTPNAPIPGSSASKIFSMIMITARITERAHDCTHLVVAH